MSHVEGSSSAHTAMPAAPSCLQEGLFSKIYGSAQGCCLVDSLLILGFRHL